MDTSIGSLKAEAGGGGGGEDTKVTMVVLPNKGNPHDQTVVLITVILVVMTLVVVVAITAVVVRKRVQKRRVREEQAKTAGYTARARDDV